VSARAEAPSGKPPVFSQFCPSKRCISHPSRRVRASPCPENNVNGSQEQASRDASRIPVLANSPPAAEGDGAPEGAYPNGSCLHGTRAPHGAPIATSLQRRAPLFSDRRSFAAYVSASFWRGLLVARGVAPAPPGGLAANETRRRRTPPRDQDASRARPSKDKVMEV